MMDRAETCPSLIPSPPDSENTDSPFVHPLVKGVFDSVAGVVVGQQTVVERILIALLTGGNLLLQGVPGLAKTLLVNAIAKANRCYSKTEMFAALESKVGSVIHSVRCPSSFMIPGRLTPLRSNSVA